MNRRITWALWLIIPAGLFPGAAAAQHEEMTHSMTTLFVARADGDKLVPARKTDATATGAFVLGVQGREARLEYDLTFDGLQNGPAQAIRLKNFGEGANGDVVHVICAPDDKPCPNATGGTVSGAWSSQDRSPLTPELVHEVAAVRIYVEIESGPGSVPELRSQLKQQPFMGMSRSFVARIGREGQAAGGITGTAAFDFVRIDEQRTFILFDLTVTGLQAPITAVNITVPGGKDVPLTLPINSANRKGGATISGQLDARRLPQIARKEFVERLRSGDFSVTLATSDKRVSQMRTKLVPLP